MGMPEDREALGVKREARAEEQGNLTPHALRLTVLSLDTLSRKRRYAKRFEFFWLRIML